MDKALAGFINRIKGTSRIRLAMMTPRQRKILETGYKAGFEDGRNSGWSEGYAQGKEEPWPFLFG